MLIVDESASRTPSRRNVYIPSRAPVSLPVSQKRERKSERSLAFGRSPSSMNELLVCPAASLPTREIREIIVRNVRNTYMTHSPIVPASLPSFSLRVARFEATLRSKFLETRDSWRNLPPPDPSLVSPRRCERTYPSIVEASARSNLARIRHDEFSSANLSFCD